MNRTQSSQSSHMAEKMELQGRRKRRVAIKDEGRSKECRTTTETITPSEKPQLNEMFHRFSSRNAQNKSAVDAVVTQRGRKKLSKDVSTRGKKFAIQTCNGEDMSRSTPNQTSTLPLAFHVLNKKHQTKKSVSSINKGAKTSSENAIPDENSSAKSLEMFSRSPYFLVKRSHICHLSTHQRDLYLTAHLKMKRSLWEMAKEKEKVTTVSLRTTKCLRSAQIGRTEATTSPIVRGTKTSHMSICHSSQSK